MWPADEQDLVLSHFVHLEEAQAKISLMLWLDLGTVLLHLQATEPFHYVNLLPKKTFHFYKRDKWDDFKSAKETQGEGIYPISTYLVQGCIQKFPDWVDNKINNNNKHLLRSNTQGYGSKTDYTDSQKSYTTAPSGRELYRSQFSLQAASLETSGYTFVLRIYIRHFQFTSYVSICISMQQTRVSRHV